VLGRPIEWASADQAGHKASGDQLYAGVGEGQNERPRTQRGVEARRVERGEEVRWVEDGREGVAGIELKKHEMN